jgi:hypothetical protein
MDSNLKSIIVGRWGAAVMAGSSFLSLILGVVLTPEEQKTIQDTGTLIIDNGFAVYSGITALIATIQATWSRVKPR